MKSCGADQRGSFFILSYKYKKPPTKSRFVKGSSAYLCQIIFKNLSAPPGARTPHTLIKSQVLYQMS